VAAATRHDAVPIDIQKVATDMFTGAPTLVLDIAASQMRDRRREARAAAERAAARHPRVFPLPGRHR
jgi:hypothetical protein